MLPVPNTDSLCARNGLAAPVAGVLFQTCQCVEHRALADIRVSRQQKNRHFVRCCPHGDCFTVGIAQGNEAQLTKIYDGTFTGQNELLGAEGGFAGYVSEEGRCQLSEDTIAKIDEAFAKVVSGEIVPASNFSGTLPDNFVGF